MISSRKGSFNSLVKVNEGDKIREKLMGTLLDDCHKTSKKTFVFHYQFNPTGTVFLETITLLVNCLFWGKVNADVWKRKLYALIEAASAEVFSFETKDCLPWLMLLLMLQKADNWTKTLKTNVSKGEIWVVGSNPTWGSEFSVLWAMPSVNRPVSYSNRVGRDLAWKGG